MEVLMYIWNIVELLSWVWEFSCSLAFVRVVFEVQKILWPLKLDKIWVEFMPASFYAFISGHYCSSLCTDLSRIVYTTIPTSNVPSIYFMLKFAKLLNVMKSPRPGQQWAPSAVAVVTNRCWWRACFLPYESQWQNSSVTSVGVVLNPRGHLHENNLPELVNKNFMLHLCAFFCWEESFARPAQRRSIVEVRAM